MANDEIECPDCDGFGWITKREATNILGDCLPCKGSGWREPTEVEADALVEAAYDRQFEGEPPMSFAERTEVQAKRDAQWGVR